MKVVLIIILSLLGAGALVLGGFVIYGAMTFGPDTSTDVADYADISKNKWNDPNLIRHFPPEVPGDATNVRLSYSSRFLQGGAHLQLRMDLPPEAFGQELEKFSGKALLTFTGGDRNDHANTEGGAPTTFFYTGDMTKKFPDDYTVLLLHINPSLEEAEQARKKERFYWNHGDNYGIAYSQATNTIVYWAESW